MAKMKIKLRDYGDFWLVVDGPKETLGRVVPKEARGSFNDTIPFLLDREIETVSFRGQALSPTEVETFKGLSKNSNNTGLAH